MATKVKLFNKDAFLSEYKLQTKFEALEGKGLLTWHDCEDIFNHYHLALKNNHNAIRTQVVENIMDIPGIHSIRSRCKDPESLLVKIINKVGDNKSKYLGLESKNYYKYITDLVGIRILVRQRGQCNKVHFELLKKFKHNPENYIKNYVDDYIDDKAACFIAEKPIAYYKTESEKKYYDASFFDIIFSKLGYSSIHYIVNIAGTYVEIQVRTLYEEAWSEVDHDFVYKEQNLEKHNHISRLSGIMSEVSSSADQIGTMIMDYGKKQTLNKAMHLTNTYIDNTFNILKSMTHSLDNFADFIKNPEYKREIKVEPKITPEMPYESVSDLLKLGNI